MIEFIGDLARGIPRLARRAAQAVEARGECAIFLSMETRRCYALTRSDPDWRTATTRNRAHLVGVYQLSKSAYVLAKWIEADMKAHAFQEAA